MKLRVRYIDKVNLNNLTLGVFSGDGQDDVSAYQILRDEILDLYDEQPIVMNLQIEDYLKAEPATQFSNSFRIPATDKNSIIFKSVFDVSQTDFDLTKKLNAWLLYDNGDTFKKGELRLLSINVDEYNKVDYECIFLGTQRDFFSSLGESTLTDLDFSDYGHTYNNTAVLNSWNASPDSPNGLIAGNVIYPIIDFGDEYDEEGNLLGTSLDLTKTNNISNTAYEIDKLKPMVRLGAVFNKIFEHVQFTYDSEWINDFDIKRLYVSAFGNEPSATNQLAGLNTAIIKQKNAISAKEYWTNTSYDPTSTQNSGIFSYLRLSYFQPLFDLEITDYNNKIFTGQFSSFLGLDINENATIYTTKPDGTINFAVNSFVDLISSQYNSLSPNQLTGSAYSMKDDDLTQEYKITYNFGMLVQNCVDPSFLQSYAIQVGAARQIFPDENNIAGDGYFQSANIHQILSGDIYLLGSGGSLGGANYLVYKPLELYLTKADLYLNNGGFEFDNIILRLISTLFNIQVGANINMIIPAFPYNTLKIERYNGFQLGEGEATLQGALQETYKLTDFMKDLMQKFRLVMIEHPEIENRLIIEPWKDYIGSGEIRDWTDKLDESKPLKIVPTWNTEPKRIIFQDKADEDLFNKLNKENFNENYGTLIFDSGIDIIKGTETKESNFSPTIHTQLRGYQGGTASSFIIPHIYNSEYKPVKPNTRLLFYNGKKTATFPFKIKDYDGTESASQTQYPMVSHLTTFPPFAGTFDLNWQREVGYVQAPNTGNNLSGFSAYDIFWKDYIDTLYDKNARRVEAYFYLTPDDIKEFQFKDVIFVKGNYYFVERMDGVEFDKAGTYKVTLIKFVKKLNFTLPAPVNLDEVWNTTDQVWNTTDNTWDD